MSAAYCDWNSLPVDPNPGWDEMPAEAPVCRCDMCEGRGPDEYEVGPDEPWEADDSYDLEVTP